MSYSTSVTLKHIEAARSRIAEHIHHTPVLTCSTLDKLSGFKLFFKCENLQKTGSFKARGALNAILLAKENEAATGIVTHSSGNHGQALAWAASTVAQLPCTVVVPEGTPVPKCQAIKGYGAKLVFCEPSPTGRKETCDKIAQETGAVIIDSYDNYNVLAGQATIAYELHNQVKDLDAILVPCSGGGMTSGIALATKALNPSCKIIAVEAKGKNLEPCLKAKKRLWSDPPQFVDTIAEGIKTQQVGHLTFPILCDLIESDVITVTDSEMIAAMRLAAERMKLILEASAGASLAAAIKLKEEGAFKNCNFQKIGVILCGGNIDVDKLPW